MEEGELKRYAYIDVSNTKSTTKVALGFSVDWEKLFTLLTDQKWNVKKVFYYEGSFANKQYAKRHDRLTKLGYVVKTKEIFLHKLKARVVKFVCTQCSVANSANPAAGQYACSSCGTLNLETGMNDPHNPKANFDVEIAVDALEYAGSDAEILLFTGDGDFRYLADKLLEKGAFVTFVSTFKKGRDGGWRFSTRLKELVAEEKRKAQATGGRPRVRFVEIDNWRNLVHRQKENGAKRDVFE